VASRPEASRTEKAKLLDAQFEELVVEAKRLREEAQTLVLL